MKFPRDCAVCGGDGWLPSLPEGESDCTYCKGTGRDNGEGRMRRPESEVDHKIAHRLTAVYHLPRFSWAWSAPAPTPKS